LVDAWVCFYPSKKSVFVDQFAMKGTQTKTTGYVNMASKCLQTAWDSVPSCGKTAIELTAAYGTWVGIHAASANAYPYFCASTTLTGLLTSPFMVAAPHCRALLWCINSGAAGIDAMWLTLGTWLSAKVFRKAWER
jgi:hypothetical protein